MKGLFIILLTCCLYSCALFQKTSKTKSADVQSSKTKLESSQLVLKSLGKETQVFTYWNDSGIYQYQHIREQIDQAEVTDTKKAENQYAKQTVTTKKDEGLRSWVYFTLIILLLGCYFFVKKYRF